MFRNLVRLRALFGNSISTTVQPVGQNCEFVLRYSTATVGKTVKLAGINFIVLKELIFILAFVLNLHGFCLPERRRFYQDVSISQGESKCYLNLWIRNLDYCYYQINNTGIDLFNQTYSFHITFIRFFLDGLFEINLDRRKLKTPGGKLFTVPNEALAIAVATEWDAQRDTLKSYTMHLVRPLVHQVFLCFLISEANFVCICNLCCGFHC